MQAPRLRRLGLGFAAVVVASGEGHDDGVTVVTDQYFRRTVQLKMVVGSQVLYEHRLRSIQMLQGRGVIVAYGRCVNDLRSGRGRRTWYFASSNLPVMIEAMRFVASP